MISFKNFVQAIQGAITSASDAIMEKNLSILEKYFVESTKHPLGGDNDKNTLVPKSITLEYPHLNSDGAIENMEIAVPLITLVPLSTSQVEKAFLSANFEMEVIDGELQLHFSDRNSRSGMFNKKHKTAWGKIELTFIPQEPSEGFKMLIAGYEDILKRQIV